MEIQRELDRMNVSEMSKQEKQKLVHKIRNKLSAKRSRIKKKEQMEKYKRENVQLKTENAILLQRIQNLQNENQILKVKLKQ